MLKLCCGWSSCIFFCILPSFSFLYFPPLCAAVVPEMAARTFIIQKCNIFVKHIWFQADSLIWIMYWIITKLLSWYVFYIVQSRESWDWAEQEQVMDDFYRIIQTIYYQLLAKKKLTSLLVSGLLSCSWSCLHFSKFLWWMTILLKFSKRWLIPEDRTSVLWHTLLKKGIPVTCKPTTIPIRKLWHWNILTFFITSMAVTALDTGIRVLNRKIEFP